MDGSLASRIEAALRDLSSDDWDAQCNSHQQLAEIGSPAVPALMSALDDPGIRLKALFALGCLGDAAAPVAAQLLLVVRKDVKYSQEASFAAVALAAMGAAAVEPVLQGLRSAREDEVRFYQEVLSDLPAEATIPALIAALSEPNGEFRLRVLWILNRKGRDAPPAIPVLIELLHDTARDVRAAAARALGAIGEPAVPRLWPLADSPQTEVAVASLQALGYHGEWSRYEPVSHAGENLLALFSRKLYASAKAVRVAAALELHRVANKHVELTLYSVLSSRDSDFEAVSIIRNLAGLHRPRGIEHRSVGELRELVYHPDTRFDARRAAAVVLLDMGADETLHRVLPILRDALHDPEDPHQLVYLRAASHAGPVAAPLIPDILMHLRLLDTERRVTALRALGDIGVGNDEVLDAILPFLENPDRRLVETATDVLGMFGPVPLRVVEALAQQLDRGWLDEDVAMTLGRIGPAAAAAVPALAAAAWKSQHRDGHFAKALGNIGTPEAIAELLTMRRDSADLNFHEWVSADAALSRLGMPSDGIGTPNDPGRTRPDDHTIDEPNFPGETDRSHADHTPMM